MFSLKETLNKLGWVAIFGQEPTRRNYYSIYSLARRSGFGTLEESQLLVDDIRLSRAVYLLT
jgi:hypothetical protein